MKRRTFVKSSALLASLAGIGPSAAQAASSQSSGKAQYYELRLYTIKTDQQKTLVDNYWREAAVPALNRLGIKPVGVFEDVNPEVKNLYVLIPYDSIEAFSTVQSRLAGDAAYRTAGAPYLDAPKSEPAYERIDSSLSIAFEGMKKLEIPPSLEGNKPWVFELRTYESSSEPKGANKVAMFNAGEIELMHQVGLSPVFFGQTVLGGRLPNLVYMVSGEDKDAHKVHWKAFFDAPVWKKLIGDSQYKDNVSKVTSVFLKRTSASQI